MAINPAPHATGRHSSKTTLNDNWAQVAAALNPIVSPTLQAITTGNDTIATATDLAYINRSAPGSTGITLPDASARLGRPLRVVDFSQTVTAHTITLTPFSVGQKIMRQSTWELFSNSVSLAAVTLIPVVDPDDDSNYVWMIAP